MDGELTGEIVNETGRRIASCAPQIAFLDSTLLNKEAPLVGTGSQIGTAKKVVVAPHYAPGHW